VRHIGWNGQQIARAQYDCFARDIEAHRAGREHSDLFVDVLVRWRGDAFFEAHSQNGHAPGVNHLPREARAQLYRGDYVPIIRLHLNHDCAEGSGDLFGVGQKLLGEDGGGRHADIGRRHSFYF
jgi:hypothetical protein